MVFEAMWCRCRKRAWERTALAAAVLYCLVGSCAHKLRVEDAATVVDVSGIFAAATASGDGKKANGGSFVRHFEVVRNGTKRDAMVLEAPVAIRADLKDAAPGSIFQCLSTPVFNIGDGMQLEVLVNEDGQWRLLYTRYYDAGRRLEDRAWIPLRLPVNLGPSARNVQLEIRVSGGPQGDLTADWLALTGLSLTRE